ncbi:hypothetical protein QFZ36_000395 [Pseudarthrobacter siccitolerans]|uniref:Uncharacterized protein n=1 Tax=Pseudarthrobacter siccitolerans TaxID=861266 RepID=A0ABU0PFU2_9MICC|nr:hypothetical protein [Pseudarthrobacter siccitolerans]
MVRNPSHVLVSWVQRGEYTGDIVVVRPSTGEVLAQAAILSLAAEKSVVYGSIDDAAVYYAISPGGEAQGFSRLRLESLALKDIGRTEQTARPSDSAGRSCCSS